MSTKKEIPLVSIIAISYNHGKYLLETLNSIIYQSYSNIQIIIMDDSSTDDSVEKIRGWIQENKIDCIFISNNENKGVCATLNEALTHCKGIYFQLIACDDILEKDKIKKQVAVLENSKEAALVCSNFLDIDSEGKILGTYYRDDFEFPEDVFSAILNGNMGYDKIIHSPTVLVRREVLKKVGIYDEDLIQEDLEMWLKIAYHYKIVFIPEPLVKYRILSSSLSKSPDLKIRLFKDRIKVATKYLEVPEKVLRENVYCNLFQNYKRLIDLLIQKGNYEEAIFFIKELYTALNGNLNINGYFKNLINKFFRKNRKLSKQIMLKYNVSTGNLLKDLIIKLS